MDSKHRHELEENDLQQFLAASRRWFEKHGTRTLTVILVLLVVVLAVRFVSNQRAQAYDAAWYSLDQTQTAEGFVQIAESSRDLALQINARLQAADTLLNEVVFPQAKPPTSESEAPSEALTNEEKLNVAAREYQQVIELASGDKYKAYRLNAYLGLAAVAEQRGEWADARKHYEAIIAEGEGFPLITAQAKGKLAWLDDLKQPVVMARDLPAEIAEPAPGIITPELGPGLDVPSDLGGESPGLGETGGPSGLIPSFDPFAPQPGDTPAPETDPTPAPEQPSNP